MPINDDLELEIDNIETGIVNKEAIEDINKKPDVATEEVVAEPIAVETPSTGEGDKSEISTGDTVELDGVNYTVNDKGELIDKDNKVFKTAQELTDLIKANETPEETDLIKDIQKEIGIEVVDENGVVVEFENTPEGIKSYVDSVIELKQEEIETATIEALVSEYPIIEQVINHIKLNGSMDGFNEIPDRTKVTISKDDEAQQVSIIKDEWKAQGKKGSVDSYIEYLKTAGTLFDTSVECLATLNEIDAATKSKQESAVKEQEAELARQEVEQWNTINSIIDSGELIGYKIPDKIVVNRNGKQTILGKADFKNYVSRPVDKEGNTGYMVDRSKEDEKSRIEDDLLRAFLKFTGSNYSSLVNMAINKEKIKNLKLSSSNNNKRTIKINTNPTHGKVDNSQVEL